MNLIFTNGGDKFIIRDKYDIIFYKEISFENLDVYQNGICDIVFDDGVLPTSYPTSCIVVPSGTIAEKVDIFNGWLQDYLTSNLATSTNQDAQLSFDSKFSNDLDIIKADLNDISSASIPDYVYSPSGALLTSDKKTLFQLRFDEDLQPNVVSIIKLTNANIALNTTTSSARFSITAGTNRHAIMQSYQKIPYYNGQPQFIDLTFQDFALETDIIKRAGTFTATTTSPYNTDFDGVFIESDGINGTYNLVIANAMSGDVYTIAQTNWDDPLDGTGASGINYDFDNFTVLSYDYLWLGGTAIRFYINYGGTKVLFYTFAHSGFFKNTIFSTPNLPFRAEIRNLTNAATGHFDLICCGISTASANNVGQNSSFIIPKVNCTAAGTEYLLAAWKIQSGKENKAVTISDLSFTSVGNDAFTILLKMDATVSASLSYSTISDTALQTSLGDGIITTSGGYLIKAFTISSNNSLSNAIDNLIRLGTTINGGRNVFTLSAIPDSNNAAILGAVNLIEK